MGPALPLEIGRARHPTDFLTASGTLVFAAGELERVLAVDAVSDTTDEDDEAFSVVFSAGPEVVLLDRVAEAVIVDNDGEVITTASLRLRIELVDSTPVLMSMPRTCRGSPGPLRFSESGPDVKPSLEI